MEVSIASHLTPSFRTVLAHGRAISPCNLSSFRGFVGSLSLSDLLGTRNFNIYWKGWLWKRGARWASGETVGQMATRPSYACEPWVHLLAQVYQYSQV